MPDPDINVQTLQNGHPNAVYGVAFSPDGRQLASASLDNHVKLMQETDSFQQFQNIRESFKIHRN